MMMGEIDYNDVFYHEENSMKGTWTTTKPGTNGNFSGPITDAIDKQLFPISAHILITIFVVFVPMIMMNLLFGLAVSDVQVE